MIKMDSLTSQAIDSIVSNNIETDAEYADFIAVVLKAKLENSVEAVKKLVPVSLYFIQHGYIDAAEKLLDSFSWLNGIELQNFLMTIKTENLKTSDSYACKLLNVTMSFHFDNIYFYPISYAIEQGYPSVMKSCLERNFPAYPSIPYCEWDRMLYKCLRGLRRLKIPVHTIVASPPLSLTGMCHQIPV